MIFWLFLFTYLFFRVHPKFQTPTYSSSGVKARRLEEDKRRSSNFSPIFISAGMPCLWGWRFALGAGMPYNRRKNGRLALTSLDNPTLLIALKS